MHGNEPRETHGGQQKQGKQKDFSKKSLKKKKSLVILSFIDIKPSHKNRRKLVLLTGSVAIAQVSSKQWEVHGKGIIAVFYVPFLPLSFMSLEKVLSLK